MTFGRYPSEPELQAIREWPHDDFKGLLAFVADIWFYPDCVKRHGNTWTLVTLGWSGNEEIIGALEQNILFRALCWQASYVGGKHVYRLRKVAK